MPVQRFELTAKSLAFVPEITGAVVNVRAAVPLLAGYGLRRA